MQDLKPADGKEVFILTDSVKLQGNAGKYDTVDYKHIHKQMWPLLSAHFKDITMISVNGWQPKDILTAITELVQAKAGGNPAAFDHVLIIMPTLFRQDELSGMGEDVIERLKPEWGDWHKLKEDSRKIGEILKPIKYKMVIGPGSEETWKSTGDAPTDMYSKELLSTFSQYDVPVISGMPLHRRLKAEEYHFQAWPVDLEPFQHTSPLP